MRKSRSKRDRYAAWIVYGKKCAVWGSFTKFWDTHVDHVIPLSRGGIDDWPNLISCHKAINIGKGAGRYPEEKEKHLVIKAEKCAPKITDLLADNNFQIPKKDATRFDLDKATVEEILADAGPTDRWDWDDTVKLVTDWVKHGIKVLRALAITLCRTIESVIAKLSSMNIYRRDFIGQTT